METQGAYPKCSCAFLHDNRLVQAAMVTALGVKDSSRVLKGFTKGITMYWHSRAMHMSM